MRVKSLAIVASRYPCKLHPTWHVFVRQIAHSLARQGAEVTVICPHSFHRGWWGGDPFRTMEDAGDGARVTVFRPRYLSMSSKRILGWNTYRATVSGAKQAARRVLNRHMPEQPAAIYGHFLYPAGAVAVALGAELGIPSFPAAGEISLDTVDRIGRETARRELKGATAFIANSTHLSSLIQQVLGQPANRIGVFPNGINRRNFHPHDKAAMRQKYGLPQDLFLVGFVGNFQPRKGPRRVAEAIKDLEGVGGVFVGSGAEAPEGKNVLLSRRAPHEQVPELMSACDVFALPTADEGCCNAILEALACGLPVVSSTGSFNDEILNTEVAIRTDPFDVGAIRAALVRLRDNKTLREGMSRKALEWSGEFDIDLRAKRLLGFMAKSSLGRCPEMAAVEAEKNAIAMYQE